MGLPGTFVGNAGEPAFAKIKRATDEFIDAVEQILRERGIARGFVRVLRPANFHIIADVQPIHIVYTNTSAGGIPAVNITDFTQQNMLTPLTGEQAIQIVERDLGYRDCEAVTRPCCAILPSKPHPFLDRNAVWRSPRFSSAIVRSMSLSYGVLVFRWLRKRPEPPS
jgi:hypothetical protein